MPVFWACGVTPQAVAMQSKPSIMITHAPGCMFISDLKDEKLSVIISHIYKIIQKHENRCYAIFMFSLHLAMKIESYHHC